VLRDQSENALPVPCAAAAAAAADDDDVVLNLPTTSFEAYGKSLHCHQDFNKLQNFRM
jgi:hypothetical protein